MPASKTSKQFLMKLANNLTEKYKAELEKMGPMLKPKVRETLVDGFRAGAQHCAFQVCGMLEVEILDVPEKEEKEG